MPVSPQDFALWSDLTGNPYPQSASERMALAPEVYNFTRNIGRRQGPGPIRRAVDVIGKTALAAGAIAGAAYLAKGFGSLDLDDEADIGALAVPQGVIPATVNDITPPTTSDRYGQDVVPHQTTAMRLLRGTSPAKPTVVDSEEKPATQSHVISSSQYFGPGSEVEQLAAKEVPYSPVVDPVDALAQQKSAAIAKAVLEAKAKSSQQIKQDRLAGFGDMGGSPDEYGTLDLYLQHQQASHQRNVSERVQRFLGGADELDSSSLLGQRSVRGAEAFRQTPEYATMMRSAGASMEPEELVGAPGKEMVLTSVRPTVETRTVVEQPIKVESPIAEMATPTTEVVVKQPVAVSAPAPSSIEGASPETIALARRTLGHLPLEQAVSLLSGNKGSQVVTAQPAKTRVAAALDPVKFAKGKAASLLEATPRGSAQQALAEAAELYEGQLTPPKGTISGFPAGGSSVIEQVRLYPNNMMGIKVKGQGVEYVHKVEPGFVPYAAEMIKSGDFYGKDYNEMKRIGVLQPHIGSEDLPRSAAAYADFISKEKARLGL